MIKDKLFEAHSIADAIPNPRTKHGRLDKKLCTCLELTALASNPTGYKVDTSYIIDSLYYELRQAINELRCLPAYRNEVPKADYEQIDTGEQLDAIELLYRMSDELHSTSYHADILAHISRDKRTDTYHSKRIDDSIRSLQIGIYDVLDNLEGLSLPASDKEVK